MDSVNLSIIYRIHLQQRSGEAPEGLKAKTALKFQGACPDVPMHCLL